MADVSISQPEVTKARAELDQMKRALAGWLKYRTINDEVLAGTRQTKKPLSYAQAVVSSARSSQAEHRLAVQMHTLLTRIEPNLRIPAPGQPGAAVDLAKIVLGGPANTSSPAAQGGWLWPALIVGGVLLTITTAIKTNAALAEEQERIACIKAGACTDSGFWIKSASIVVLSWFAWTKLGVGDRVKEMIRKR